MEKVTLFELDTPYRERMTIEACAFGPEDAETSVGIVGAMRGNEVQQAFICASAVRRLQAAEAAGMLADDVRIVVVPEVNSFSMNIAHRFWPMDNTDINRMFPGYDQGETTQRIADGLFRAIQSCAYGIQLCSFYLPGEFEPHVRVTDTGAIDLARSWELARLFGLPYAVLKEPAPFDTTTLNYNWQVWGTHAFSLYSPKTDHIDEASATYMVDCIMRFLAGTGALRDGAAGAEGNAEGGAEAPSSVSRETFGSAKEGAGEGAEGAGALRGDAADEGRVESAAPPFVLPSAPLFETRQMRESSLANVRTSRAGFFRRAVYVTDRVKRGDVLAEILSTQDCAVLEELVSPCDGTVFFRHGPAMANADTIAFKIAPETPET